MTSHSNAQHHLTSLGNYRFPRGELQWNQLKGGGSRVQTADLVGGAELGHVFGDRARGGSFRRRYEIIGIKTTFDKV